LESRNSNEERIALLIDADNVSAKYFKAIMDELSKYGTVTIKRIYGDWTLTLHAKWKDALLENSITPIQQFGYTQGKNATDSAMIIDAMDILYSNSVDCFCIVSSDSDFTRLAARIRESGLRVIGMGEKKTPTPFRKACDIFTVLELLMRDKSKTRKPRRGKTQNGPNASMLTKEEVEEAVVEIVTDNMNRDKATGLGEIGSRLQKRHPDFDVRNYGTSQLIKLLSEFPSLVITKEGYSITVGLADYNNGLSDETEKPEEAETEKPQTQEKETSRETYKSEPNSHLVKRRVRKLNYRESSSQKKSGYAEKTNKQPGQNDELNSEIEAYLHKSLEDAGESGIALAVLGKRLRNHFRSFRLRDLGYTHLRDYLNDLKGVTVKNIDGTTVVLLED
jgi:uncharacterized protein (TIGR00288 family)